MSAKNSLIACLDEIAPVTRGRSFVRSTNPSTLRSAKSLITHPALRIRKVPRVKMATKCSGGKPSAAIHSAANVGHSSNNVPTGLSRRMSCK